VHLSRHENISGTMLLPKSSRQTAGNADIHVTVPDNARSFSPGSTAADACEEHDQLGVLDARRVCFDVSAGRGYKWTHFPPRGEFGFDGESDEDSHGSYGLLHGAPHAEPLQMALSPPGHRLKPVASKLGSGAGDTLGAASGDVAVGFVPTDGTLESCGYGPCLET
jgi:hypothetical protein